MTDVEISLADETIEALDAIAREEHGGDRDEAARALLAEWLEKRR